MKAFRARESPPKDFTNQSKTVGKLILTSPRASISPTIAPRRPFSSYAQLNSASFSQILQVPWIRITISRRRLAVQNDDPGGMIPTFVLAVRPNDRRIARQQGISRFTGLDRIMTRDTSIINLVYSMRSILPKHWADISPHAFFCLPTKCSLSRGKNSVLYLLSTNSSNLFTFVPSIVI